MNVLSLFDGMSCLQIALNRIGINPDVYYAAEIDKWAIQVTQANYPNTIQLGDVTKWKEWDIDWASIDLVTGGFPCQAWSMAGKQLGDKDERGMLFWVMLDIMKYAKSCNPSVKFLIENVKMKKEFEKYITYHTEQALVHVEKTLINSALVSAQNRNRYYWTNFPVTQPEDKGLVLADIIESGYVDRDKSLTVTTRVAGATEKRYLEKSMHQMVIDDLMKDPRVGGVSINDGKIRPHRGDSRKSGLSEYGSIITYFGLKCDTLTTAHAPKVLCGSLIGRKINHQTGKRDDYNPNLKTEQRLELRSDEKTGTLTTVQKDNVIVRLGNVNPSGNGMNGNVYHTRGLSPTLTTNKGEGLKISDSDKLSYRKLTPLECERLQTVPDNYTVHVSNTQRYKMLGNGWTVDVIAHILKQGFKS